jgi:regulator of sirC expression with transglutaminase-like and TPR domain
MELDDLLGMLAEDPGANVDLAEVSLQIARDEYRQLDVEGYLAELDGLAYEARSYLGKGLAGQVAGLCRYLFHEAGFHGNETEYYDPRNSYLNDVLDRQTGIPITLSIVTMAVGRRLGVLVEGVGLPGHFIVMARDDGERVLFDPFHNGRSLEPGDCAELVRQAAGVEVDATAELLQPAPAGAIVTRMLTNLKGCYLRRGDFRRAARAIQRLMQIQPTDVSQQRDLGVCCFRAGRAGRAIDHLESYLQDAPGAEDAETVEKLLRQAEAEVAKWN